MLGLASKPQSVPFRRMPSASATKRYTEQEAVGLALRRLRKRADLTQEEAGERAGVTSTTWRRYELGLRDLSFDQLAHLAGAVGATRDELLAERAELKGEAGSPTVTIVARAPNFGRMPETTALPLRDRVQAGAWLAADDYGQAHPQMLSAIRDARYPQADQWLSEVVGDSVDRLFIFGGDYVHCVDAIAINYAPKTGDLVEVERLRFGGAERELTLKQVEVAPDGSIQLWPRSNNPRWQQPISLADGAGDGEEIEVRIRGLVISSIRRFG